MLHAGTILHRVLLTPASVAVIEEITGWAVDNSWEVSSRKWRRPLSYYNSSYAGKITDGGNLITVFHYGKRAVVFSDEELLSFTGKYRAGDFDGPSTLASRGKYELFDDHRGHDGHCKACRV